MKKNFRYLVRLIPIIETKDPVKLVKEIGLHVSSSIVNPKFTSYGAIELDIFTNSEEDFNLLISLIEPLFDVEFIHDLNKPEQHLSEEKAVFKAIEFFNAERFWEAHEILESVWRNKAEKEKVLVQGLILVCAAYVHLQKKETQTALNVLKRAKKNLENFKGFYYSLNIDKIKSTIELQIETGKISFFKI